METKLCKKCLVEKPLTDFHPHPRMLDGHLNKCKACACADVRENYAKRRSYYQNYDRLRYDRDGQRSISARTPEAAKAWSRRNPEKRKAQGILARALQRGLVIRGLACDACGASDVEIEAHHDDYSKPLDVKWICTRCHGGTRKKTRDADMLPTGTPGYRGKMQATRVGPIP